MFCFCLDNKCFARSLVGHRDAGFFTFGQLNSFIRKLCYRSLLPKFSPKENDWSQLPILRTETLRQLSSRNFLARLKLKQDLDQTATANVKRDHSDKEGPIPNLAKLVEECKEKFVSKARGYLLFLLQMFLDHHSINAEIVRGLASFDPHDVLLGLPTEQATYCLAALYQSFSLRGWLEGSTEDACRDEYVEFADQFRDRYASLKDSPEGFTDMVDLLSQMPELRSRHHLYRLFRLSCLCLTEDTAMLPPIRFQDVDAESPQCRFGDVLMPAQSHLARVPDAINVCNNEDALIKYRELEAQFNSGNVAADPWSHVDAFGRAEIYKAPQSTYKTLFQPPKSASSSRSGSRSSSAATVGRGKTSPGKGKKKVSFDGSGVSKGSENNQESGSKVTKS